MNIKRLATFGAVLITCTLFISVFPDVLQAESPHVRVVHDKGLEIKLDLSTQVLGLDIPVDIERIDNPWDMSSQRWTQNTKEGTEEATLYPTIKNILGSQSSPDFLSASIFIAKAKQFDDGLMAAVEYLCQKGSKNLPGKQLLLQQLAATLKSFAKDTGYDEEALNSQKGLLEQFSEIIKKLVNDNGFVESPLNYCRSFINAAANLGGQEIAETNAIKLKAKDLESEFLQNQLKSKPIGFYTWTDELSGIFQQDRLLQTILREKAVIKTLSSGLLNNEEAMTVYKTYLSFIQRLTNPFPPEYCDLSQIQTIQLNKKYCFFPPSQAHETQLGKKLYGNRSIPEGFSLIDALLEKIQEGEIDLTPKEDSGWYDHQVYALEPFVKFESMPEAKKIEISETYKKELIDLFKASIALSRETHVKQLEEPRFGMALPPPTIDIYPELSIEPIATYYLRRAESYRFIRELLVSTFGHSGLREVYRLTPSGKVAKPLLHELKEMESLFYGAYQIVTEDIGMVKGYSDERSTKQREADKQFTIEWIFQITDDKDVGTDNRMMIPVFYDIERKKTKVWVMLGYAVKPLSISFKQAPEAKIIDAEGNTAEAKLEFKSTEENLIYPVSAEIYVDNILNRDEFRNLCDKHKTRSAILFSLDN